MIQLRLLAAVASLAAGVSTWVVVIMLVRDVL